MDTKKQNRKDNQNMLNNKQFKDMTASEIAAFKLGYSCGQFDAPNNLINQYVK